MPLLETNRSIIEEHFASSGFGFSVQEDDSGERVARWTRQQLEEPTTLYFKLQVYRQLEEQLPTLAVPDIHKASLEPEQEVAMARRIPLGRAGIDGECGSVALFLASPMSAYVTGATVPVDGGTAASGGWLRDREGNWTLTGE